MRTKHLKDLAENEAFKPIERNNYFICFNGIQEVSENYFKRFFKITKIKKIFSDGKLLSIKSKTIS